MKDPKSTPYVPADSAEYLEGPMPKYQDDPNWEVGDSNVNVNDLDNPMDPDAGMEP